METTHAKPEHRDAGDDIADMARGLASRRNGDRPDAEIRAEVAAGLARISDAARERGQARISRACKVLSIILARVDRDRDGDADFILSTALHFLDALQAKRVHTGRGPA